MRATGTMAPMPPPSFPSPLPALTSPTLRSPGPGLRQRLCQAIALGLLLALWLGFPGSAHASLENDRYDGNIFSLYAGNGSLVPPRSTLAQALAAHRTAVLIFYLDDSSVSKRFAPQVSELQRLWGNRIDLIPLVSDPLQGRPDLGPSDPAHYWRGEIPQVVVLDGDGRLLLDATGSVPLETINQAISTATGLPLPAGGGSSGTLSINELNREVVKQP